MWTSSGGAGFEIAPAERRAGERVRARHRDRAAPEGRREEISRSRTRSSASSRTYSDHILFPIELVDGQGRGRARSMPPARCGSGSKSELKPEDYTQAYQLDRASPSTSPR